MRPPIRMRLGAKRWELFTGRGISPVRCTTECPWIQTNLDKRAERSSGSSLGGTQATSLRDEATALPSSRDYNVRAAPGSTRCLLLVVNSDVLEFFPFWSGTVHGRRAAFAVGGDHS